MTDVGKDKDVLPEAGEGQNPVGAEARPKVKEAIVSGEKRELSPEQADQLLEALKTRFELPENEELRKAIDFTDVEKSLRAAPEKLYALHKMEETGGEPQIIGVDGDEFIFEDRCKESPSGRRNMDWYQAFAQSKEFGTEMQSAGSYYVMQSASDGEYDLHTSNWLETEPTYLKNCNSGLIGHGWYADIYIHDYKADSHGPVLGWRASLRVPKV